MLLVAPQGFEPRLSESESLVLPLNEGATLGSGVAPRADSHSNQSTELASAGQTGMVQKWCTEATSTATESTPPATWRGIHHV